MNILKWRLPDASSNRDKVLTRYVAGYRVERQDVLDRITHDLTDFAISKGYTDAQVQGALETFFETFAPFVVAYLQVGGTTLSDAVSADATIPWLDTLAQGVTLRQRIINRLS